MKKQLTLFGEFLVYLVMTMIVIYIVLSFVSLILITLLA